MLGLTNMKAIKWSSLIIAVLALNYGAFAGETTSHKDDKNVVEVPWVNDNHTSVDCGDIYGSILADDDETLTIMITASVRQGESWGFLRLFSVGKEYLTPEHTTSGLAFGCLTENGGLGIYVPHQASINDSVSIQIDNNGHVFVGYDEVGLQLFKPLKAKTPTPQDDN